MKNKSFKAAAVFAVLFSAIFVLSVNCHAQTVSSILKDDNVLSQLFVYPVGLTNPLESYDSESLKGDIENIDKDFKYMDLGQLGQVVMMQFPEISLGGVPVTSATLILNDAFNGIMYQSEPCDNYKDMGTYLGDYLKKFSKSSEDMDLGDGQMSIYMLSDRYGVGLATMDRQKISMAFLMDMHNINALMGMIPGLPVSPQ